MYPVNFDVTHWRYMFGPLFERCLNFARKVETEIDPYAATKARFVQLLTNAPGIYLVVDLEPPQMTQVTAHAFILVPHPTTMLLEQMAIDDPRSPFVEHLLHWMQTTLKDVHPEVTRVLIATSRDERALGRKYGFKRMRMMLERPLFAPRAPETEGLS